MSGMSPDRAPFRPGSGGGLRTPFLAVLVVSTLGLVSPQSEKELLAAFDRAFSARDPAQRVAALAALGQDTRTLPDKGVGKPVAKALAKGLTDEELDVRAAAVEQLSYGRDVDTAIAALGPFLEDGLAALEGCIGRDDKDARDGLSRGSVLFQNGCHALETYRDDRSVAVLAPLLAKLKAHPDEGGLAELLVEDLATSALTLGTQGAVAAAVKLTKALGAPTSKAAAEKLHQALSAFAKHVGREPPEWREDLAAAWQAWFEANKGKFPEKLGRLKAPPMDGASRPINGLPGKSG